MHKPNRRLACASSILRFSGIGFATSQTGGVGALGTYETSDGAESWREAANVGEHINRFRMLSPTLGYAVGKTVYEFSPDQSTSVFDNKNAVPTTLALLQNHPNPFEVSATIASHLKQSGFVDLSVRDIRGQAVVALVREQKPRGKTARGLTDPSSRMAFIFAKFNPAILSKCKK